jgi:hypothetical protein
MPYLPKVRKERGLTDLSKLFYPAKLVCQTTRLPGELKAKEFHQQSLVKKNSELT